MDSTILVVKVFHWVPAGIVSMASKTLPVLFQAPKRLRLSENVHIGVMASPPRGCPSTSLSVTNTSHQMSLKTNANGQEKVSNQQSKAVLDLETLTDANESKQFQEDGAHDLFQNNDSPIVGESNLCTKEEDDSSMDATLEGKVELKPQQRKRIELNKGMALARRNLRLCEEKAAEAAGQGLGFPRLADLLVEQMWLGALEGEFQKPYIEKLSQFVKQEAEGRIPIYPPTAKIFNAFNTCPFDKVKVVIIGQDPYHGPGQAMGLCFSVEKGIKVPSSLVNIFKEIRDDVGCSIPNHGNLDKWAHQGVLLLNTVLTVREHHANSHAKKGWELFTDAAIRAVSLQKSGVVFLLWGNSAQDKIRLINGKAHHVLKAAHPSGLSAHRGFFKCRHFSQTNKILEKAGLLPIDWQI